MTITQIDLSKYRTHQDYFFFYFRGVCLLLGVSFSWGYQKPFQCYISRPSYNSCFPFSPLFLAAQLIIFHLIHHIVQDVMDHKKRWLFMMSSFETKVAHSCGCWLASTFIYLSSSSLRLLSQSELLVLRYYCSSLFSRSRGSFPSLFSAFDLYLPFPCLPVHYFLSFLPLFPLTLSLGNI